MGEAHRRAEAQAELQRRNANTYLANRSQSLSEQRRQQTERQLGVEESLLGTEQQVSGQLGGVSADVLPYVGRYQFDPAALSLKSNAWGGGSLGDKRTNIQGRTDAANTLLQQAEDAARAGDFTGADRLKAEAKAALTAKSKAFGELGATAGMDQIWSLTEDPSMAARTRLASPQAQLVGHQLQEARQFQDFESAASINERRLMGEAGERSIAAGERDVARQNRLGAASAGGGAQSAYGRQLADERMGREVGQQKAALFTDVAQKFQDMQRQYGKDTVSFANAWLQGTSGMRESFQQASDQLATNFSNLSQQFATMNQEMSQFQFQRKDTEQARKDARSAYYRDLIVGVSGAALGLGGLPSVTNKNAPQPTGDKQKSGGLDFGALMKIFTGGLGG